MALKSAMHAVCTPHRTREPNASEASGRANRRRGGCRGAEASWQAGFDGTNPVLDDRDRGQLLNQRLQARDAPLLDCEVGEAVQDQVQAVGWHKAGEGASRMMAERQPDMARAGGGVRATHQMAPRSSTTTSLTLTLGVARQSVSVRTACAFVRAACSPAELFMAAEAPQDTFPLSVSP